MDRRDFIRSGAVLAAASAASPLLAQGEGQAVEVTVDTGAVTGPLPHIWAECAGSDRAAITLREHWRHDLDRWRKEIGLKRVRFHGIFADELGVYAPSILNRNKPTPNWRNVFEVYDGLIERGAAPFVELGFMPKALATGPSAFGFYQANITPPKSNEAWAEFIATFVKALIGRYGIGPVRSWMFEVWNEPDLPFFWTGNQQQYFDLYKATAVAIKSVDPQLQVGGPATSGGHWVGDFAAYCAQNNAPVDFFATHAYAGGNQEALYGKGVRYSINDVIPDTVKKVSETVAASSFANRPIWLTEWSSDSPAMIAHVVSRCLPMLRAMSHWTLSGEYEELGVPDYLLKEGDNGWPAMFRGIARPNFNTYKLLSQLGEERLATTGPALAARKNGRAVSALVWNLAEAQQAAGIPGSTSVRKVEGSTRRIDVRFARAKAGAAVRVSFVDQERGSPMPAWRKMGSPQYPTTAQIMALRKASDIAPPVLMRLDAKGAVSLTLPPEGVALIELA
ncbi:MAG: glycosyl hydrolase [Sphingobium sp.]